MGPDQPVAEKKKKAKANIHVHIPKGSLKTSLKGVKLEEKVCIVAEGRIITFDKSEYGDEEKSFRVELDSLEIHDERPGDFKDKDHKEYRRKRMEE